MTRALLALRRPASAFVGWLGLRSHDGNGALRFNYDAEVDHLMGHLGQPVPCYNIEVDPGVVIRISQDTHRVAGLEVVDCATLFNKAPGDITLDFVLNLLNEYGPKAMTKLQNSTATLAAGMP